MGAQIMDKNQMMLPDYLSSDWLDRYSQVYEVSPEEARQALDNALGYAHTRRVKCQVPDCFHLAGPFILPLDDKVLVLRYLCLEHWLMAMEEAYYQGICDPDEEKGG
jgi:hypothetical protein